MMKRFAAFIMTYKRPEIICSTIDALLGQSMQPETILVIDNSEDNETETLITNLGNPFVRYYRVGRNSGPAGGAYYGLQMLANEGYEWIFWGDDDDPPKKNDCFEQLLNGVSDLKNPGIIGAVGHYLDSGSGIINRVSDSELEGRKWLSVDVVAGGMCLIANGEMVRKGILPNPDLFFGFEDLDICLKAKRNGYNIYANCALFLFYRKNSKRPLAIAGKRGLKRAEAALWRDYYSSRNLLHIFHKNRMRKAFVSQYVRMILKIPYCFRFGWRYGRKNAFFIFQALRDFHNGRLNRLVA